MALPFEQTSKNKAQSSKHGLFTTHMLLRIDYSHNRAISRCIFALERKARFLSAAPEDQFAHAGADRINRDQRLPLRLQVLVERLNNEQFTVMQRFVLHRELLVVQSLNKNL